MGMARPNQAFQGGVGGGGFRQPQQFQGSPNKGGGTAGQQTPFGGQSSYGTQTGWGQPQQQQATHPFQGFQAPQYSGVQGGGFGQPQQQFQGGPSKGGGGLFGNVSQAPAPWKTAPAMGALPDLDRLGAGIPPLQTANLYNQMRIGAAPAIAPPPLAPWQTSLPVDALGGYDRMPTREFSLPVIQPPAPIPENIAPIVPPMMTPPAGVPAATVQQALATRMPAAGVPAAGVPAGGLQPGDTLSQTGLGHEIIGGQLPELPQAEKDRREKLYQDRMASQKRFRDENPLQPRNPDYLAVRPDFRAREERLEGDVLEGDLLGREPLIDRRIAEEALPERQASLAKRLGITGEQYADQVERERADRGLAPNLPVLGVPVDVGLEEYGGLERDDARRQMERDMEMDMEMDMARDASRRQARDQQKRLAFEQQLGQRGGPIGWQQALGAGLGVIRPQMRRPIPVPRTPMVRKPIR